MQFFTITRMQCEASEGLEVEVKADEKMKGIFQDLLGERGLHRGKNCVAREFT